MKRHIQQVTAKVTIPYSIYVMLFLGIGLLSGSLVHFPLNPHRYTIIGGIGILLFLIGSYFNEKVINKNDVFKHGLGSALAFLFCSLTLSIGIGMISGGTQHFNEIPEYASKLIPIGITLSFMSYVFKNKIPLENKEFLVVVFKTIIIVFSVFLLLTYYSVTIDVPKEDHTH